LLAAGARGQRTGAYDQAHEEHKSSRGFTKLHEVLLKIDTRYNSMADYLISLKPEEIATVIDMPDALGRTPLAWAVEYGLTFPIELLLRFGANPNQLRFTKDGGFSPLIHLAIAGPRSAWMDEDIIETVRLLLVAGADVNAIDHEGWTPLHIAASWSLFSVTDMLRQYGREFLNWQARTLTGENMFDVCDNTDYQNRYWSMVEGPMSLI
jgi:ankyrin repeat protein